MSKQHDRRCEAAKKAIDEVMSDRSVSPADTRGSLEDLKEHIDVIIESLPEEEVGGE